MKENELQTLIAYRLKRAAETLTEAQLMQREAHWNTCANRLYYAAFYAVSALLAHEGYVASKHTGIKAMFNQHFVKTGMVTKKTAVSTIVYSICVKKAITWTSFHLKQTQLNH